MYGGRGPVGTFEEDKRMMFRLCGMDSNGTINWEEFKFLHDRMESEARKPERVLGGHAYKEVEGEIRRYGGASSASCPRLPPAVGSISPAPASLDAERLPRTRSCSRGSTTTSVTWSVT